MKVNEFLKKVFALIEEYNPNEALQTDDTDLQAKAIEVVNQVMYEMARIKKIPMYVEIKVTEGKVLKKTDIENRLGYEVFQIGEICGADCDSKADGTVYKFLEDGVAEITAYILPERISVENMENYEFEVSSDVLEIMVYGVAADLLKSDQSAAYGNVYAQRYNDLKNTLDTRYQATSITISGGGL